jgi:hypothetical protein
MGKRPGKKPSKNPVKKPSKKPGDPDAHLAQAATPTMSFSMCQ